MNALTSKLGWNLKACIKSVKKSPGEISELSKNPVRKSEIKNGQIRVYGTKKKSRL